MRGDRASAMKIGRPCCDRRGCDWPALTAANPTDAAETETGDIIVTARRQQEWLQDVPVSVTALGVAELREQHIDSEASLQIATPGLTVRATSSSNQLNYSIRGQSIDSFSYSAPAVLACRRTVRAGPAPPIFET